MKYTEFKNGLQSGEIYSVYLLEGEDAYFREKALKLLADKFVTEPEVNSAAFEGNADLSEVLSSLMAYPFMSRKRLTVIREFYPKAEVFKKTLKDFAENPPQEALFVIINEKPHEPLKKFSSLCVVDCGKASPALLMKWVKARCMGLNVNIDAETAGLLVEYCLADMTRIENETEKLIAYVGDGGTIDKAVLDGCVTRSTEYKIYEMTECIGRKKFGNALEIINDLTSKGETSQRILVYVYNYFRRLLHISIANCTDSELGSMLGVKEYAVKKMREQSAKFSRRSLKRAVDMLADSDYKIKSGVVDADEQMWLAIFKIITDK